MRASLCGLVTLALLAVLASSAYAQGKGKGLGKALRDSGRASHGASMRRASTAMARAKKLSHASKGLQAAARGLPQRGPKVSLPDMATRIHGRMNGLQRQRRNAQRQLDHHLARANQLRALAAEQGSPDLAAQADLIEARAHEQFAGRTQNIDQFEARHGLAPQPEPVPPVGNPGGDTGQPQPPAEGSPPDAGTGTPPLDPVAAPTPATVEPTIADTLLDLLPLGE